MGGFSDILRRNRIYAALLFVLIALNALVLSEWAGKRSVRVFVHVPETSLPEEDADASPGKIKMFSRDDLKARQERIDAMAEENPRLYFFLGAVNLSMLFVIFLGLIIDFVLLSRRFRGKSMDISLCPVEKAKWNLADVVRAVLIFIFAGYVFAFVQTFFFVRFPILRNVNFRMVTDTAFMNIAGITVIFYFVFVKYRQSASAIGLSRVSVKKAVLTAGIGYAAVLPVLAGIMILTFFFVSMTKYEPPVQPIVEVFILEKRASVLWISTMFAAIFGPVAEEIFFRGFLYPAARGKWGIFAAIMGTSFVFSLLHSHLVGFLPIMALGVLLTYLYEKTGSLLVPITVHVMHNVGMVILVFMTRAIGI
ncbi:MAG: type II CAAX endopeptidase family protein [Candidatus Omnitrophota bacterium]